MHRNAKRKSAGPQAAMPPAAVVRCIGLLLAVGTAACHGVGAPVLHLRRSDVPALAATALVPGLLLALLTVAGVLALRCRMMRLLRRQEALEHEALHAERAAEPPAVEGAAAPAAGVGGDKQTLPQQGAAKPAAGSKEQKVEYGEKEADKGKGGKEGKKKAGGDGADAKAAGATSKAAGGGEKK